MKREVEYLKAVLRRCPGSDFDHIEALVRIAVWVIGMQLDAMGIEDPEGNYLLGRFDFWYRRNEADPS